MADSQNHALVFGGTGLIGWGVVNELLSGYPSQGVFGRVSAVTNRPLREDDTYWPKKTPNAPQLQIASGVNLLHGTAEDLAKQLGEMVEGIESVTHIFYFVFSPHNEDFEEECDINCGMMRRVAGAANMLCPNLKSIVYSGGTRGYGIYVPNGTFTAPLGEAMADSLPPDYAKTVAYPWFRQILSEAGRGRWTWTEVCPDAVVGFTPMGSAFSLALHWAQYLSLYAHNHGARDDNNVEVPFPGTDAALDAKFTPVSTPVLGRISIHAALHPDRCGAKVINTLDAAQPTTFRELWPQLTAWFHLVGTGPSPAPVEPPSEYIAQHRHVFADAGRPRGVTAGVGAGSQQLDSVGYWLTFDRQLSPERLRAVGFAEERAPVEGWLEAFQRLRDAGIIL